MSTATAPHRASRTAAEGRPLLFSPYRLAGVTFPNRLVVAPMQMYVADQDGKLNDWHFQHLARFATGGFGTVMTEALMVEARGRNTYGDCGIWEDGHVAPLRRLVDFLHGQGTLAAAQLHHAGPKASRQRPWEGRGPLGAVESARGEAAWQPIAASSGKTLDNWHEPRAATLEDIREIVAAYGQGARRADEAGFDVLDIHAAHGYLIHSFLSPVNNDRTDAYGDSLEGRMRLALEIAEELRRFWPKDKPLIFRISCVDWRPDLDERKDGWSLEDSIVLAKALKARGVDMIDCSSGGIRSASSGTDFLLKRQPLRKGHQTPYAERIRREADIATMAVGVIVDGPQAEAILQARKSDLIAIGREALVDPHWALNAARALGIDDPWSMWPPSYGWWLKMREEIGIAD
ncbi:NADH:flavin oxidoreductase/NADH oxidase [Aureimonas mangrovi]|uniref:NADH:flavin oxidoreductase/NADH oxidase n=1 Tax=Aureimonas mangrovi TaxID=2758041 RepID=UPI00163D7ED7|nr:NADH:flavin oxidoreductase/NADH oxidase [Aureimonas mangrovi]